MSFEQQATRLAVELARRHDVTLRWGERPRAYRGMRCVVSPRPTSPERLAALLHEIGHCAIDLDHRGLSRSRRSWREAAASEWAWRRYEQSNLPGIDDAARYWRSSLATYLNEDKLSPADVAASIPERLRPETAA